ncbi:putative protease Do-like 14 isoform X5 [Rhodamnia argentea]|uniref:Protease Do-like 14 isoform X5 n=1 Tax=Rhodamnia argentea TaxID=178133 RepID=A0ABM3H7M0_9MYRT|nr:putative protease Do-like 14 isoform X5 [Rhodamnia argentea]
MLQMAGIAVAGSVLFQANAGKSRLLVPNPAQLHREFMRPLPAFISLNKQRHEVLQSRCLPTSWIKCFDTNKAASAKSEEKARPNKGHFGRDTVADAAAKIAPAVASLCARKQGQNVDGEMGSGTAIHKDGYILTCAHVVFGTTNVDYSADLEVVVRLQEAEKDLVGQVVDAYVDLDIAIIKIEKPPSPLSAAKVGSSSKLRPGDWAIAMGCPLSLQHTVTLGIISGVHRTSHDLSRGGMMEYLQTDCAINLGNSGGPLCNVDGEVVGVNVETVKPVKASGVSFAVPVDFISAIIKPFQNFQRDIQPDFGWIMWNICENNFEALKQSYHKFPNAIDVGVFVLKVIKGSPADRAGIQTGDVVVELNGKPVRNIKEMMDAMGERSGAPVQVLVERARDGMDASVPLTITFQEKGVARS